MRRDSPGFVEWLIVTILIVSVLLLLFQLYQYGSVRQAFPRGLTIAGVPVGEKTVDETTALLTARYLDAPVTIYHRNTSFRLAPSQAEFTLDFEAMLTQAEIIRDTQNYWAGFLGYLVRQPIAVDPVLIQANHSEVALKDALRAILEENNLDQIAVAPASDTDLLGYRDGQAGIETDLEASLDDVTAALYRPTSRSADLRLVNVVAPEQTINLLNSSIINLSQEFEAVTGGVVSVYVVNLETGEELYYNPRIPMTGLNLLNIAGMLEFSRRNQLTKADAPLFKQAATDNDEAVLNLLLDALKRPNEENGYAAAKRVTELLQTLGLVNSYIGCPVGGDWQCQAYSTEANREANGLISPSIHFQTTAEDMALLLSMIYDCAVYDGGALRAVFDQAITDNECAIMIEALKQNRTASLLEQGIPPDVNIAHRHAWLTDTYGDAGIIFSPAGDYIMVEYTHKPGYLDWDNSSRLMAALSRSTYNYFNFEDQFLE